MQDLQLAKVIRLALEYARVDRELQAATRLREQVEVHIARLQVQRDGLDAALVIEVGPAESVSADVLHAFGIDYDVSLGVISRSDCA